MSVQSLSGQVLGQYELHELIGIGGMSAVYHGYQPELDRHVAVKVLSGNLSREPGYAERFILEAKTIAALEHPHIIPIYDYGTQDGISYFVMRLMTGGTLAQRLDQRLYDRAALPSLGETAQLTKQLASALDYAHERGVIHRDVKSGNVMFDRQGHAYLVDFGIAKLVSSNVSLTQEGHIMGTAAYMAPEQWRGEPLTPATDQYAVGVLIYLLVTGTLPFDAPTSAGLMYKHLNDQPVAASALRPDATEAVDTVLQRALAKDADARYPTVKALADDFEQAVQGVEGTETGFFTFPLAQETIPMSSIPVTPESDFEAPSLPVPENSPRQVAVPPPIPPAPLMPPPAFAPKRPPQPRPSVDHTNWAVPVLIGVGIGLLVLLFLALLLLAVASPFLAMLPMAL